MRTCEDDVALNKCEGTCASSIQPSAVERSGFTKVKLLMFFFYDDRKWLQRAASIYRHSYIALLAASVHPTFVSCFRSLLCHISLRAKNRLRQAASRAGHFRYFFKIFSIIKNHFIAFFKIKLITYFCTSPI